MPIYEYECECGNVFEKLAYDLRNKPCPECGTTAERIISRTHSRFKEGYPKFVDKIDDHQKRQVDRGEMPTLPPPRLVL